MNYIIVIFGAGIGGGLRYFISDISTKIFPLYFPVGTLIVNVIGSLLLGLLIFGFDEKELLSQNLKLLLGVGFCGGFTTFSTFGHETVAFMRDGEFLHAVGNVLIQVIIVLSGVWLGYNVTRYVGGAQ